MMPDKNIRCPATAFARTCREIVAECECPKFVSIKGIDPQSGVTVDRWGCVDTFLPMLLIENAQQTRQAGAAIESMRNEMTGAADKNRAVIARVMGQPTHRVLE